MVRQSDVSVIVFTVKNVKRMQKYKENPNDENIHRISGYNLIKLNANKLKLMQAAGLRIDDARYLPAYEAYRNMRRMSIPRKRMYDFIREEFGVSRTTMQEVAGSSHGRCGCSSWAACTSSQRDGSGA